MGIFFLFLIMWIGFSIALWICITGKAKREELKHRRRFGLCLECGYSLAGNTSGVCPECGVPVAL